MVDTISSHEYMRPDGRFIVLNKLEIKLVGIENEIVSGKTRCGCAVGLFSGDTSF